MHWIRRIDQGQRKLQPRIAIIQYMIGGQGANYAQRLQLYRQLRAAPVTSTYRSLAKVS